MEEGVWTRGEGHPPPLDGTRETREMPLSPSYHRHQGGLEGISARYSIIKSTPVGFEPTRAEPIGFAGRRLNRSAKVSHA